MPGTPAAITDEDLLKLPRDGNKYELVDGQLLVGPAGWLHEQIVMRLASRLVAFVESKGLGTVLGSNALFVLPSGNKRGPDISFVAAGRLDRARGEAFPKLSPDLAVEVLSPGDSTRRVLDKVGEYLEAGVRLVWVIDPKRRSAAVHRSLGDVRTVTGEGVLDGEDVIPGFRCHLADIID
jgi:Uma2 family endonuclease